MNVAIIGAGPAGITAAYILSKNDVKVEVFEASSRIGGMSSTIELWGQKVDIGPHRFFSNDRKVNQIWLEANGQDYVMVDRLTRIYYNGVFFDYPLKLGNTLRNLGVGDAIKSIFSYIGEKLIPSIQDNSFESWVKSRFGSHLFNIFFKTYSEKLWGIRCNELDSDFAAQRIKRLSLYEAIKHAFLGGRGNGHKTLVDQFAYPTGGTGKTYENMAKKIVKNGGQVHLNNRIHRVVNFLDKSLAIELASGEIKQFDHIISTMPLTSLVTRLNDVPESIIDCANKLEYRNTIIVYLLIDSVTLFPDNWIYVHSADLKMGRVTNFRNWAPQLYDTEQKTIIALEYWCNFNTDLWNLSDNDLISLAKNEICSTELVPGHLIEEGFIYRVPKSYPIYRKGYKEFLKPIYDYLSSFENLSIIGRYGSFKYNNQDHSILMGLLAAENIMLKTNHSLSEINTDYETYQESCTISESGLQEIN